MPEDPEETEEQPTLRPRALSEYVGQKRVVETLKIAIDAAQFRGDVLDHVLFHGPPGLGKTTLAQIIAHEMGGKFVPTAGPMLDKSGDLMGILTNLERGDVLFIDEIHRLPRQVEEFLYSAMEDFAVDIIFDRGAHARPHRFRLFPFTLVGATTRAGLLSAPLRDRFGIYRDLDFYSIEELEQVVHRSAAILEIPIEAQGATEIARRSRGTPRIANRLLKRVRDFAQVRADGAVTNSVAGEALRLEGVDEMGLTPQDRRFLEVIIRFYGGGPVGIDALAATLQEEADTLVDVVEPYLLKIGFVTRSPAGRRASAEACRHLGLIADQVHPRLDLT
ncbi:MAG TPA: Holliday junction branch migration DNA helicase RuvB [Armatimonadota bacterium]|nr:Holliday junction branch migration DNA helicase RuvB [Armatimonadota bacterium]